MKAQPTAVPEIIHEHWREHKDKTSTVKLRVTYKKISRTWVLKYPKLKELPLSKLYGKTISLSKNEFLMATGKKKSKIFDELSLNLAELKSHAKYVIKEMSTFSFERFEALFFTEPKDVSDLLAALQSTGDEFHKNGKISTAGTYNCTINSLKEFSGKEKLPFAAITVPFLKDYEKWMLTPRIIKIKGKGKEKEKEKEKKNSRTTVSIYLRNVRTIFNKVKPEGVEYPFGKSKNGLYAVPKGKNTKKALTQADVAKIAKFDTIKGTFEQKSRDYWLFSYLCNGINIKDMARLKYSNIDGDKITLIRAKTADTVEEQSTISIPVTPNISRIIDHWGSKPALPDQYVFDILKDKMYPEDEYRAIRQAVQTINKNMTRICAELKIDRATTYTARHSFATVLKRSGASVEFISESLGHKSKQTTMNYLANFEDEEKKKWANMLLPDTEI